MLDIFNYKYVATHSYKNMLALCQEVAQHSPDSKKVGCVIASPEDEVLMWACNDFVRGAAQTPERLQRPTKYIWIEHAERNAIYKAAMAGIPLEGTTMYINWWPCIDCCRAIIQSGIKKIVSSQGPDFDHPRWGDQFRAAQQILDESDVEQVIVPPTIADLRRLNSDNLVDCKLENVHDMIINGNYTYALELFREIKCTNPEYKAFEEWLIKKTRKRSD